jgi:V8-like Glu-specific endopeptidase
MPNIDACKNNKWVFDFKKETSEFNESNVYSCKNIIAQKYNYALDKVEDYAVIELDRPVTDRQPLEFRKHGKIKNNVKILVIGHPMGLPMKITDGARTTTMNDKELENKKESKLARENYFTSNLDVYAGNSGSPVFNEKTGLVEGILIRGAEDFVFDEENLCEKSVQLSDDAKNSYEKVMRITKIPEIN